MAKTFIHIDDQPYDVSDVGHPTDRMFRNAWQLSGTVIDIDMPAARELHRDNLRRERTAAFEPLDVDVSQKMVSGDMVGAQTSEAQRQALRDITSDPRIETAETPEDLQSLTLEVLSTT